MASTLFYAQFCSVFAIFGVIFMFIFGYLFDNQPLYLKGPVDKAAAASGCYSASGLYFVVWVASLVYWSYDSYKNKDLTGNDAEYSGIETSTRGKPYGSIRIAT
jgi:hypothetical protein